MSKLNDTERLDFILEVLDIHGTNGFNVIFERGPNEELNRKEIDRIIKKYKLGNKLYGRS